MATQIIYKEGSLPIKEFKLEMEDGENTFIIIFADPDNLTKFIRYNEQYNIYAQFCDREPTLKYPSYLIKIQMKKNNPNKINSINNPNLNPEQKFLMMQQQQLMGVNPLMNPQMMDLQRMNPEDPSLGFHKLIGMFPGGDYRQQPIIGVPDSAGFNSIQEVNKRKEEFMKLDPQFQIAILKKLYRAKLYEYQDIVNLDDQQQVEGILSTLTDPNLFNMEETLETLNNPSQLKDLIIEAVQLQNEQQ